MSDGENKEGVGPSWKIRRRVIISTLLYCATMVIYIVVFGESNKVNETVVLSHSALASTVIIAYIGGATWEAKKK